MKDATTFLPWKRLRSLPLKQVKIEDVFWAGHQRLIREVVIPYQWDALNDRIPDATPSHCIRNFRIAAGLERGEFQGVIFQDSDLAKWLEAVAYNLETHPDCGLEQTADEVITLIERAQQPDGYLNTYYTLKEPGKRWTNFREGHELYCAGHLIEAAVAYYNATGKRRLLDVVCRFADHIDTVIGTKPGKLKAYPGHQEIELALVKLFRVTGNVRYLDLGKYFIDERGREPYYFDIETGKRGNTFYFPEFEKFDRTYAQTHLPVRQQSTAEGHAVRAVYMYSAMADLAVEAGDQQLFEACRKIWENIVTRRMYITGGIGAAAFGEAFTFDYDLPNDTMYTETCASVGLFFFAQRMLQLELNHCYADVMEKTLYNTILAGMALDGKHFFYVNPLEVWPEACEKNPAKNHVKVSRQKWFGVACCPPNIARLLSSLGRYIYSQAEDEIFIHLYIGNRAAFEIRGEKIQLIQETNYPWDGRVRVSVTTAGPCEMALTFRIPGWCRQATLRVNGMEIDDATPKSGGYITLRRTWNPGDYIELEFSMPVVLMRSDPNVRADIGKLAIQRGPMVYCLEEADNGKDLHRISIRPDEVFAAEFDPDLLGGVVVISGEAERVADSTWGCELYRIADKDRRDKVMIKAIPYCFWNNREPGEMLVWIREG